MDRPGLLENIRRMQAAADEYGVELWPHIKTHKMVEIARLQLAAGARGLTCAKSSEAEAMLPSGVRRIFIAHSLVSPLLAPRLRKLAAALTWFLAGEGCERAGNRPSAASGPGSRLPLCQSGGFRVCRGRWRDRLTVEHRRARQGSVTREEGGALRILDPETVG